MGCINAIPLQIVRFGRAAEFMRPRRFVDGRKASRAANPPVCDPFESGSACEFSAWRVVLCCKYDRDCKPDTTSWPIGSGGGRARFVLMAGSDAGLRGSNHPLKPVTGTGAEWGPPRWEQRRRMGIGAEIVLVLLVVLPAVLVGGLFVWAAFKDGQADRAVQARLGFRRRTRLGR